MNYKKEESTMSKYGPYPKARCKLCHKSIYRGGIHTRFDDWYHKSCYKKELHRK